MKPVVAVRLNVGVVESVGLSPKGLDGYVQRDARLLAPVMTVALAGHGVEVLVAWLTPPGSVPAVTVMVVLVAPSITVTLSLSWLAT